MLRVNQVSNYRFPNVYPNLDVPALRWALTFLCCLGLRGERVGCMCLQSATGLRTRWTRVTPSFFWGGFSWSEFMHSGTPQSLLVVGILLLSAKGTSFQIAMQIALPFSHSWWHRKVQDQSCCDALLWGGVFPRKSQIHFGVLPRCNLYA